MKRPSWGTSRRRSRSRSGVPTPAAAAVLAGMATSAFLALFDPALDLVLAATMARIGLVVPLAARPAARAAARVQVAARSDLAAAMVDAVQGLPDLLALGREPAFLAGPDEIGRPPPRSSRR
jgi:ABC-type transport system involved in cytochrome bd biosynthesis fused ATPase/permease subunit